MTRSAASPTRRALPSGRAAIRPAAALVLALLVAACGSTDDTATPASSPPATTPATATAAPVALPAAVQSVDITGTEYVFEVRPAGGAPLRPGWTKVRFRNDGAEAHQVMFARLRDGVDMAQLAAAAGGDSSGSAAIEYVDMLGGVSYIGPGRAIEAMVDLPEGTVLAMCYVPDAHGVAHALMGMSTVLAVAADPGPDAAAGVAATGTPATAGSNGAETEPVRGTIVMDAAGYHLPDTLERGWYHVVNRDGGAPGHGLHELSILGLREDLSASGLDRLLRDLATNTTPSVPLDAVGGMGALSSGLEAYLFLDLAPGPYLAVDFMPDPGDPKPHLLDGYVTPFRA